MPYRAIPEELEQWCEQVKADTEAAYLSYGADEPWKQSGMSGPEQRWKALRKPVADAVEHSGSFLDIGCANGYLLESVIEWTKERGIAIDPHGLDISEKLIGLAKERLPAYADHFYVGNAFAWIPERRFDYVATMLDIAPEKYEEEYIHFLLEHHVAPQGKLLLLKTGAYEEPEVWLHERLGRYGIIHGRILNGYDPFNNRQTSVAVIHRDER